MKGFARDFASIKNEWEGMSLTRVRVTESHDKRAKIIGVENSNLVFMGVINSVEQAVHMKDIGWLNHSNSVGFFEGGDFKVGDYILMGTQKFEIVQIIGIIYDQGVAIASTVELGRVS